jgi:hypothetical protein
MRGVLWKGVDFCELLKASADYEHGARDQREGASRGARADFRHSESSRRQLRCTGNQ